MKMNYKLTPRFYYTLSLLSYFKFGYKESDNIFQRGINFNSARTALRLLLSSISSKDLKVGVQAFTCHTVFQAIKKSGHNAVFIDVNNNFQLCLMDLAKKIDKLDVLIVTHTFGFPEQMERIKEIAKNVIIIEDCAHSFLSKSNKVLTGELADGSIFSTGLAKFPAIGSGGFCLINNINKFPFYNEEYRKLKPQGFLSSAVSFVKTLFLAALMKAPFYGLITYPLGKKLDSKLDFIDKFSFKENLQCSWVKHVFLSNQKNFSTQLAIQKDNSDYLSSLLDSSIKTIAINNGDEPNNYVFAIRVKERDLLFTELLENNIESGKHFSKSLEWALEFGYKPNACINTEIIINQVITLPIHKGVNKKVIKRMSEIVNKYA